MLDEIANDWERAQYADLMAEMLDDQSSGATTGIVAGTRVATSVGWIAIERIAAGDAVLTFDAGLRTVRAIKCAPMWAGVGRCPAHFRPVHVPQGVLGNSHAMTLLPRQGVLIESDLAESHTGDPFALVRAESLVGICGIRRSEPTMPTNVYLLQFDEDQIVFTAHGALCVCPAVGDILARVSWDAADRDYHMLSEDIDRELINSIREEIEETWMNDCDEGVLGGAA